MAEEVLKYKVEIDQGDLATQLGSIKNQIDTALGSFAFSQNAPTQSSFQNSIVGGVANFTENATSLGNQFQQSIQSSRAIFTDNLNTAQLGYKKFTEDLELAGLTSPSGYARQFQSLYSATRDYAPEQLEKYGFLRSGLGATFGMGYNYDMKISRGEYRRKMLENVQEKAGGAAWNTATTAAFFIPGLGIPAGLGMMAAGAIGKAMNYEETGTQNLAKFIETTSFRNISGTLDKTEAYDAAKSIRNLRYDTEIRATVGGAKEIEGVIAEFATSGGFLDTTNVEEFKRRAKETIENFKVVQHALKTTTQDAVQVMGELIQGNLATGSADAANLIGRAVSVGERTGFSGKEVLQVAAQGAEMVRGTGINLRQGAESAMDMLDIVRGGMRDTVFSKELIAQGGGSVQTALSMQQTAYGMAATPLGRLSIAAEMGGLSGGVGSFQDIMKNAMIAGKDWSLDSIIDLQIGMREKVSDKSAPDLMRSNVMNLMGIWQEYGYDVSNKARVTQLLINSGYGPIKAEQAAALTFTNPLNEISTYYEDIAKQRERRYDEQPSQWQLAKARVATDVEETWQNTGGEIVRNIGETMQDWGKFLFGFNADWNKRAKSLRLGGGLWARKQMLTTEKYANPDNFSLTKQAELDELTMTEKQANEVISKIISPEKQQEWLKKYNEPRDIYHDYLTGDIISEDTKKWATEAHRYAGKEGSVVRMLRMAGMHEQATALTKGLYEIGKEDIVSGKKLTEMTWQELRELQNDENLTDSEKRTIESAFKGIDTSLEMETFVTSKVLVESIKMPEEDVKEFLSSKYKKKKDRKEIKKFLEDSEVNKEIIDLIIGAATKPAWLSGKKGIKNYTAAIKDPQTLKELKEAEKLLDDLNLDEDKDEDKEEIAILKKIKPYFSNTLINSTRKQLKNLEIALYTNEEIAAREYINENWNDEQFGALPEKIQDPLSFQRKLKTVIEKAKKNERPISMEEIEPILKQDKYISERMNIANKFSALTGIEYTLNEQTLAKNIDSRFEGIDEEEAIKLYHKESLFLFSEIANALKNPNKGTSGVNTSIP